MNEKLKDKLQKIELLLDNDNELDKYINDIENTQISYPNKLEEKILLKVNRNKSVYYLNICKMVACVVVALILCQTNYIKGTDFNKQNQVNQEVIQKNTFLDNKLNEISNFFMKPINLEKGEK